MTLELGDHVWYWNGNISLDKNIPRAQWFPGSNPNDPNDYQGNGKEIYNYVIHANEIARGRPHMRVKPNKGTKSPTDIFVTDDYEAISRFCSSRFLTPQKL